MIYNQAIQDIAKYTQAKSQFEKSAILEVANDHGEDPETVAVDVRKARKIINLKE